MVEDRIPHWDDGSLADTVLDETASLASGTKAQAPLPALRFTGAATLTAARRDFVKNTPRVDLLFDSGAGAVGAGDPQSTYADGFAQWPPTGSVLTYHLTTGGSLTTSVPSSSKSASLILDPAARPLTDLPAGDNPWAADPAWDWTTVPAPDALAFATPPLRHAMTIVGPATVDLWVKSSAPVEDFGVTVTEARPTSSEEEYVTSGFLRSSNQVDLPNSTRLFTDPTYLAKDARTLSRRKYTLVKIPVDPIAHTFRPGTELRIVISAPGGDRPLWAFATLDHDQSATVGLGGVTASALVVNEVTGVKSTPTLPSCGSLRGEPCRALQPEGNQGSQ